MASLWRRAPLRLFWCTAVAISGLFGAGRTDGTPPAWWASRGVINPSAQPSDYSILNHGQLKNLAAQACAELEARIPLTGAGVPIRTLVYQWQQTTTQRDDFASVNIGQLKNVAKLFLQRLAAIGYKDRPVVAGQAFPWTDGTDDDDDFAYANIGQAKQLFSFDLTTDSDGDGLPDWWERGFLGDLAHDGTADSDGDGISDLDEARYGLNPNDANDALADADGDLIPNLVEIQNGLNPLNPQDALGDLDGDGLTNQQEIQAGTLMTNADTDGDGKSDKFELGHGGDPLHAGTWHRFRFAAGRVGHHLTLVTPEGSHQLVARLAYVDTACWAEIDFEVPQQSAVLYDDTVSQYFDLSGTRPADIYDVATEAEPYFWWGTSGAWEPRRYILMPASKAQHLIYVPSGMPWYGMSVIPYPGRSRCSCQMGNGCSRVTSSR